MPTASTTDSTVITNAAGLGVANSPAAISTNAATNAPHSPADISTNSVANAPDSPAAISTNSATANAPGPLSRNSYHSATGPIEYTFLNDYMFHIVFQDTYILTGLLCALLRLTPEQILSVAVTNPIEPGESIQDKTFILDIRVILNDSFNINLELQVADPGNWPERSLSYLCRTFDSLYKGEDYKDARAAVHVGILDFTLFPEHPEFYASYRLMNEKNNHIYSDKFILNVLDLNQTELATPEDKAHGLDCWAALFKAATWEELKMLAAKNPCIDTAAQKLYESSVELMIRENCRAQREQEIRARRMKEQELLMREQEAQLQKQEAHLQAQEAHIQEQETHIQKQETHIQEQNAQLQKQEAHLQEQASLMKEQEAHLQEQNAQLQKQEAQLQEQTSLIAFLRAENARLKQNAKTD